MSVRILLIPSDLVSLDDLVVACLPLDPRFMGSNLAKDDGFLRVIHIHSTNFFTGEVKPLTWVVMTVV
jgi:hypothetical protein